MITLSASGGSVTFEFSGNSTYLNDGQITVPVNSLALIIDESDMATFRKAASNDIFVSANIAEFGMTKAELESWYKANMVGSTGGGGGVTSGEVQTMIDESISGKVDTSTYTAYTADTSTKVSSAWSKSIRDLAWYPTASGLTLEYSILSGGTYQFAVQPLDDSLTYDENKLSIYGKGNKGVVTMNISQKTSIYYFPYIYRNLDNSTISLTTSVLVELNPSFSGSVSSKAIGVIYTKQGGTQRTAFWDYDSGTDSFTLNSQSSSYDGVNIWYDSSTKTIQFIKNYFSSDQALWIDGVRCGNFSTYIAASSNPTDASCYVSYVKLKDTQIKKLQEVLDEKQIKLTAGNDINLDSSGNISTNIIVTGNTRLATINETIGAAQVDLPLYLYPCHEVVMHKNLNYTGSTPATRAINAIYLDADGNQLLPNWTYNSGTDSFTNVSTYTGLTLTYDNVANTITLTLDPSCQTIVQVGSNKGIAGTSDLTQASRYIGLVTAESNQYNVQEALDNKVDTSDVTTAVTSGSTDVLTSGGAYEQFGGLKLVKLTESEYAALVTKDPDVLYVVIPDPTNP